MSAKLVFPFPFPTIQTLCQFSFVCNIHFTFSAFIFKDCYQVSGFSFSSLCFYFKCLCLTAPCFFCPSLGDLQQNNQSQSFSLFSYKTEIIYLPYHTQQAVTMAHKIIHNKVFKTIKH